MSLTKPPYLIVSIEGNIGAGKTTLLDALEEHYRNHANVIILREPVEEWENVKDEQNDSILTNYYREPAKYAFSFQVFIFQSLRKLLEETISKLCGDMTDDERSETRIIFCERSLLSSRFIFERMLFEQHVINPIEHHIYEMLYDAPMTHLYPDLMIYLACPPQICMERVLQRNRHGEHNITLEYLTTCDTYYQQNLMNLVKRPVSSHEKPCIIINVSADSNPEGHGSGSFGVWITQIESFLTHVSRSPTFPHHPR